jgi:hypothetical protein
MLARQLRATDDAPWAPESATATPHPLRRRTDGTSRAA